MQKIKISFVLLSAGMGGAEQVVVNMLKNIDRTKFDIYLITNDEMLLYFTSLVKKEKILSIGKLFKFSKNTFINKVINKLITKIDLRKILIKSKKNEIENFIKKNNIQILHSHLMYDLYATNLINKQKFNIKTIYTVHAFLNLDQSINIYTVLSHDDYISLIKNNDYITTVSELLTDLTIEVIPDIRDKCTTILNALDRKDFLSFSHSQSSSNGHQKIELLFMGGEKLVKGGNILIDAFEILIKKFKYTNLHLTILGPLNESSKFYKLITENKTIASYLSIVGFVEPPRHLAYIEKCDIMILPSYTEGMPLAMFEGLRLGKCILASKIPTFKHYIEEGENGLLFDLDPKSLAMTIDKITQNHILLEKIKDNNRIYPIPYWDEIIKEYEDLYFKIIEGNQ